MMILKVRRWSSAREQNQEKPARTFPFLPAKQCEKEQKNEYKFD